MNLNPHYLTHAPKDEHYIISTNDTKFKGIVKNNETAAFIMEHDIKNILYKLRYIGALVE